MCAGAALSRVCPAGVAGGQSLGEGPPGGQGVDPGGGGRGSAVLMAPHLPPSPGSAAPAASSDGRQQQGDAEGPNQRRPAAHVISKFEWRTQRFVFVSLILMSCGALL